MERITKLRAVFLLVLVGILMAAGMLGRFLTTLS